MISIITDPAIGGSFLSWTIHYLSGHTQYYHHKLGWCDLPKNPLTEINAHKFNPNQILQVRSEPLKITTFISKLLGVPKDYQIVYFHNDFPHESVINTLAMENLGEQVILVTIPKSHHHYQTKFAKRSYANTISGTSEYYGSWEEQHQDFLNYFFSEAQQKWNLSDTKEVWTHREFLALNCRPYKTISVLVYMYIYINSDCRFKSPFLPYFIIVLP
jgi:hypothetical protein